METLNRLQTDLTNLGGAQLSGKIQCLDITMDGRINVLYRMQLVQSTGYIYDSDERGSLCRRSGFEK